MVAAPHGCGSHVARDTWLPHPCGRALCHHGITARSAGRLATDQVKTQCLQQPRVKQRPGHAQASATGDSADLAAPSLSSPRMRCCSRSTPRCPLSPRGPCRSPSRSLGEPSERFPRPWIVTTRIPGEPADRAPVTPGAAADEALAAFLTALHQPAPGRGAPRPGERRTAGRSYGILRRSSCCGHRAGADS
jgi:hypothetical protein